MFFACMAAANWGAAEEDAEPSGQRLFGAARVVQLHLTMDEKQFAAMLPAAPPFGQPGFGPPGFGQPPQSTENAHRNTFGVEFPWRRGDVTFEGETFTDVGVRYKGNYTFMATARGLKKSLKIDLNKHVKGQKLDGLSKLSLHCNVSDPTLAREAFSYKYFQAAGVPAPRAVFAELSLTVPGRYDQEYVGVYTLVEQVNKDFLKRRFERGEGMLLKPEGLPSGPEHLGPDWKAYKNRYKPVNSPTEAEKQRLIDFTRLVSSGADEEFAQAIGEFLDLDPFLRFIAVNTLLSNLDSYLGFGHNYYLYLPPMSGKFVFIPWDLDLSLATWPAVGMPEQLVELSIHHPHAGKNPLLDRLFAIPEHKERYLEIMRELTSTSFTSKALLGALEEMEAALKEPRAKERRAVAERKEDAGAGFGPGFGGQFGQSMPPRRFIEKRIASVEAQLAGRSKGFEPKPVNFGFGPPGGAPPGGPRPPRPGP